VNIFAGIMKCDIVAEGIIKATEQVKVDVPIVVRLTGTNADKAFEMVDAFSKGDAIKRGIKLIVQNDFDKAAEEVVK